MDEIVTRQNDYDQDQIIPYQMGDELHRIKMKKFIIELIVGKRAPPLYYQSGEFFKIMVANPGEAKQFDSYDLAETARLKLRHPHRHRVIPLESSPALGTIRHHSPIF